MNNRTLTAANSVIMLTVDGLFNTPRQLQGFAANNIFGIEGFTQNQTSMGVDGRLSGGFVHTAKQMTISLEADSLSNDLFERWAAAEQQRRESYIAGGIVVLPATNRKYTLTRGFLNVMAMPSGQQVLQARQYSITWEKIEAATAL